MSNRTVVTGGIWAENAPDVPTGGEPTAGVTYANSNMNESEIQSAWRFKTVVDSANANELLRRLTALTQMMETKGGLAWCATTEYEEGAFAIGSNNSLYIALLANTGNDPISDIVNWKLYSSTFLGASATAVNSDKLDGYPASNEDGAIPISNGTLCVNLNAEFLGGKPENYYQPVPPGTIFHTASQVPPTGYLAADGSQVNRETYADLFEAIGTIFGSGNGSTTFNIPDLRGQFIRGWDTGGGIDPGRTFGSDQTDEIKSHFHSKTVSTTSESGWGNPWASGGAVDGPPYTFDTDAAGGTETRPVNVALLAIIKY